MPAGRPTKFQENFIDLIKWMVPVLGCTDEQLAELFRVNVLTIYDWKIKHPEFSKALAEAKERHKTEKVESKLLERAMGYTHDDVHISNYKGEITVTPITKHYPPDMGAIKLWLSNRDPNRWADKQEVNHTGEIVITKAEEDL